MAVAALLASVVSARSGAAQVSGLLKKAKQQVTSPVASPNGSVAFDSVVMELEPARLDSVITGLKAGAAVIHGTNGSPGRAAMQARRDSLLRRSDELASANAKLLEADQEKRSKIQECRDQAFSARSTERSTQLQQKAATDPAFRQKMTDLAREMGAAQARGDTATVAKLQRQLLSMGGAGPSDSAAVDKQCGALPPAPAAAAQIEAINTEVHRLDAALREMETAASAAEQKASRMRPRQFAMARERILLFLGRPKGSTVRGFSPAEISALNARRAELEQTL
jgi:hypothetical protein